MNLDRHTVHRSSDHISKGVDVVTLINRAKSDAKKEKKKMVVFASAAFGGLLLFGFIIS